MFLSLFCYLLLFDFFRVSNFQTCAEEKGGECFFEDGQPFEDDQQLETPFRFVKFHRGDHEKRTEGKTRVWFVRHGQAMHNLVDCSLCLKGKADPLKELPLFKETRGSDDQIVRCQDCADPVLTPVGWKDIEASRQSLRKFLSEQEGRSMNAFETLMYFDRIHFSPLSRTIDTTGILFFDNWGTSKNVVEDLQLPRSISNPSGVLDRIKERLISQPLVQEVGGGKEPCDTGIAPLDLRQKFPQFPLCCNLPDDWMKPKMTPRQRAKKFKNDFVKGIVLDMRDSGGGQDILIVAHYGIIREFLPSDHFQNGEIQRCEYDKRKNRFQRCVVIHGESAGWANI